MKQQIPPLDNEKDFEDLVCDLFNKENKTITFKKFGTQGHNQKGIDIFSSEFDIAIQCKKKDISRKKSILKKELFGDIENDISKIKIQNLKISITKLFIVTTVEDHPDFDEYCDEMKTQSDCDFEILFWGWNTIKEKVLNHKELLEKYYPNFIVKLEEKEEKFLKIQDIKKRIKLDFEPWVNFELKKRKYNSNMIIRKYDDKSYPDSNEPNEFGNYNWFRAEFHRLYHNGLEFIIGIQDIIPLENDKWRFLMQGEKHSNVIRVFIIGRIDYNEIIDYDIDGDEYYVYPHIFCKFIYNGNPFKEVYYEDVNRVYNKFYEKNGEK